MMLDLPDYRVTGTTADGRFRAIHRDTSRKVAIEVRGPDETVAAVLAAHTLDTVAHRGIARILEWGVLPDKRTWIASELPEGISLADVMLRRQLAAEEIAALLRDASDILAAVHRHNAVHGRLRPDAIVFGTGTRHAPVIIGDWIGMRAPGVLADDDALDLSVYAAPELLGAFDGRADIYALGVIAYRAFTGRFPDADVEHVPGAPAALSTLLVRMLAANPARRPTAPEVHLLAGRLLEADRAIEARFPRARWTPPSGVLSLRAREVVIALDKRKHS